MATGNTLTFMHCHEVTHLCRVESTSHEGQFRAADVLLRRTNGSFVRVVSHRSAIGRNETILTCLPRLGGRSSAQNSPEWIAADPQAQNAAEWILPGAKWRRVDSRIVHSKRFCAWSRPFEALFAPGAIGQSSIRSAFAPGAVPRMTHSPRAVLQRSAQPTAETYTLV